jgi:hypothetical protein
MTVIPISISHAIVDDHYQAQRQQAKIGFQPLHFDSSFLISVFL